MNSPYGHRAGQPAWQAGPRAAPGGSPYGPPPGAGFAYGPPPGWGYPPPPAPPAGSGSLFGNPRFVRGAVIGALALYLLTNEDAQQAAIKTLVRVRSLVQGGVEEMKERFRDAEAELHATEAQGGE
jgi:hypothetical protein